MDADKMKTKVNDQLSIGEMDFATFSKKFKCSISRRLEHRPFYHSQPMERRTYIIYIDIRTMLPFNPITEEDCLNCVSFSSDESASNAKMKAYEFLKEKYK